MDASGMSYPVSLRTRPATSIPDVARADAAGSQAGVDPADARWDLLLACTAGYILMAVGRVHQLFPFVEPLRPAVLTGALAILLYLTDGSPERQLHRVMVRATRLLLALLTWITLSTFSSLWPGASFALLFDNFVKTTFMFIVLAAATRGLRDVERLAMAYLAGATIYAAIVVMRFDVGSGPDWRLGRLYYYDANDFATFAVTAMPLGLYLLHAGRTGVARLLASGSLAMLTLAFARSGSRGGFIALVAVVAYILLRYRAISFAWRAGAFALVGVVLVAAANEQYWRQMTTILSDADYNVTEESGRLQIWERGIGYMLSYPVLGVGPNNFQAAEGTLSPFASRQQLGIGVRWNAAHNSYVQAGAELGIPGLLLLLMFIAAGFRALRCAAGSPTREAPELSQALTASLIGFVVGAFFLSLAYAEMLYALVALAVAAQKVTAPIRRFATEV
jgi:O-antigen ligase